MMLKKLPVLVLLTALSACGDSSNDNSSKTAAANIKYQRITAVNYSSLPAEDYATITDLNKLLDSGEIQQLLANKIRYREHKYNNQNHFQQLIDWNESNLISYQNDVTYQANGEQTNIIENEIKYYELEESTSPSLITESITKWDNAKQRAISTMDYSISYVSTGEQSYSYTVERKFYYDEHNRLTSSTIANPTYPDEYVEREIFYHADNNHTKQLKLYGAPNELRYDINIIRDQYQRYIAEVLVRHSRQTESQFVRLYLHNEELSAVTYIQLTIDELTSGNLQPNQWVQIVEYEDTNECSEYSSVITATWIAPYSLCQTKVDAPSTSHIPNMSELGL